MPIVITHKQLNRSTAAINALIDKEVPRPLALKLRKIIRHVRDDNDAYNDTLEKIRGEFTVKDECGKVVHPIDRATGEEDQTKVKWTDQEGLIKAIKEIDAQTVEIPSEPIPIADFGDIKLKTAWLIDLDWLITE